MIKVIQISWCIIRVVTQYIYHGIINPLVPKGRNIYRIAKISFLRKEKMNEKISYERRVYESVDDERIS